jgi:hypothetical protein
MLVQFGDLDFYQYFLVNTPSGIIKGMRVKKSSSNKGLVNCILFLPENKLDVSLIDEDNYVEPLNTADI